MKNAIYKSDAYLEPFKGEIDERYAKMAKTIKSIDATEGLDFFTMSYKSFGLHVMADNSIQGLEWAPEAEAICLRGEFNEWRRLEFNYEKLEFGKWRINIPAKEDGSCRIPFDSKLKLTILNVKTGQLFDRISPWARYVKQTKDCVSYDWHFYPAKLNPEPTYVPRFDRPQRPKGLKIYEAHVGIGSPKEGITTYAEFTNDVLPRIAENGYNAIGLMAIQEHAYYASFGYQVTSFFAASSRYGTPNELKELIDCAHGLGIQVLLDLVHSHASSNVADGLNQFDGSDGCFFKGDHPAWGSKLFDYGAWEVMRFLLSNCRYWIDEFGFDGFRFDGVTSMLYHHHGVGVGFSGSYNEYFGEQANKEAINYLQMANHFLHRTYPFVITIAEDVSGMPGMCRPANEGGIGFDYRLAMAIPDMWIKLLKEQVDEQWDIGHIVHTLENRRSNEKVIAYAESHDQAIVGDKTIAHWLLDSEIYSNMSVLSVRTDRVDRALALHKMIRLLVHGLGGEGYLNFIGNEFGHPEWLDFPREGNKESYKHCRRQFNLVDDQLLRYQFLNKWDAAINKTEAKFNWLSSGPAYVLKKHQDDKVIVFDRGCCLFAFNFHGSQSLPDYQIGLRQPGKYRLILDSDQKTDFDGHGRLANGQEFFTQPNEYDGHAQTITLYLPSRTALVLERVD